jgi:serine/threonine protein phosphatase PrpC
MPFVLTLLSEMAFGEGKKDQDRARWYGPGQVACVCDGVSSSPCSGQGAELVVSHAPVMFGGRDPDNLRTVCDLLMAWRREYEQSEITFPKGISPAMRDTLQKITREKQATSFQTTAVAAQIICGEKAVSVHILKCGDSAFFAFSNEGELLSSSLTHGPHNHRATPNKCNNHCCLFDGMSFGPGDQILIRIEGVLSNYRELGHRAQIQDKHLKNWLVCCPVEICGGGAHPIDSSRSPLHRLSLGPTDYLLVPRYLHGTQLTSQGQRYQVLDYSSTIRVLSADGPDASYNRIVQRGTTTKVLPDHFYSGHVESYVDCFPINTHFVLCSDGFYSGFSDARCLWEWLRHNAGALSHQDERQPVLKWLHSHLYARSGDDDISFVWAYPGKADAPGLSRTQE